MTSIGGQHGGLIFHPEHWNMMNMLRAMHKEALILTARSDLCVCLKQPPHCPGSERREREAAQRCVWSDSLNLRQLSSAAMISYAPPERVMNGTAESHNDHIFNRRWHWEKTRLSLLSVMRVLDCIAGGGREDCFDPDLDDFAWLRFSTVLACGWVWTYWNNIIHPMLSFSIKQKIINKCPNSSLFNSFFSCKDSCILLQKNKLINHNCWNNFYNPLLKI